MPIRLAVALIALLLMPTGCTVAVQPTPEPCPYPQPGPPPLPPIVGPEALRRHDAAEHAARIGTEAALALCARRLETVRGSK